MIKFKFTPNKIKKIHKIFCLCVTIITFVVLLSLSIKETFAVETPTVDVTEGDVETPVAEVEEEFEVEKDWEDGDYHIEFAVQDENGNAVASEGVRVKITNESGNVVYGWCKDPYASAVWSNGDVTYKKSENVSESAMAAYQNIMDSSCDESEQSALLRTYAVESGNVSYGNLYNEETEKKYQSLADGTYTYGNSEAENAEFRQKLDNARNAAATSASGTDTGLRGTKVDSATYVLESDEKLTYNTSHCTETEVGGKFRYSCSIKDKCESDPDYDEKFNFENPTSPGDGTPEGTPDGGAGGDTCAPCKVEVYVADYAGSSQEFVACVDQNGNSRGEGGNMYNSSGTELTPEEYQDLLNAPDTDSGLGEIELNCDDYTDDIECDPMLDYINGQSDGTMICMPTGETVIFVDELYYEEVEDIAGCVFDGQDEAGNPNIASSYFYPALENAAYDSRADLQLCQIYCTEDYEMELPGPTADLLTDEVMVNAGTFFTLTTGEIKSYTTPKCYLKQNYEMLVYAIDLQRQKIAEAFTNYQKGKTATSGYSIDRGTCAQCNSCEHYDSDGNPTGVYADCTQCGCQTWNWTYTFKGNNPYKTASLIPTKTSSSANYIEAVGFETGQCGVSDTKPSSCSDAENFISTYSGYDESYFNDEKEAANDRIENALEVWSTKCTNDWHYETKMNGDIYQNENCQTELDFWYEDLANFDGKGKDPEVNLDGIPSITEKKEDSSDPVEKTPKIGDCSTSKCDNSTTETVDKYDYYMKTETAVAKYKLEANFCNPYKDTDETFFCGTECSSLCPENYGEIISGFPVSIDTPQGKYSYRYDYNGIGHFFNGSCFEGNAETPIGRLEDIIENYDTSLSYKSYDNTCVYSVNHCPACLVRCVDKGDGARTGCNLPFHVCNTGCKVACAGGGCILDFNAGFLVTYRTISLNDVFPSIALDLDRLDLLAAATPYSTVSSTKHFVGSNWDRTFPKANDTLKEIEDTNGEEIYNKEPQYSIELTPEIINQIRNENEEYDYSNKSNLTCGKEEGRSYATCTSEFVTRYVTRGSNAKFKQYPGFTSDPFVGPAWK